jgi:hypothetical protein
MAAAGERGGEEIQQRALGLVRDLRRQVAASRLGYERGKALRDTAIILHTVS